MSEIYARRTHESRTRKGRERDADERAMGYTPIWANPYSVQADFFVDCPFPPSRGETSGAATVSRGERGGAAVASRGKRDEATTAGGDEVDAGGNCERQRGFGSSRGEC